MCAHQLICVPSAVHTSTYVHCAKQVVYTHIWAHQKTHVHAAMHSGTHMHFSTCVCTQSCAPQHTQAQHVQTYTHWHTCAQHSLRAFSALTPLWVSPHGITTWWGWGQERGVWVRHCGIVFTFCLYLCLPCAEFCLLSFAFNEETKGNLEISLLV